MAIEKGLNLTDTKAPINPFGVFRFPPTKTLIPGEKFLMGKAGSGTLKYKGTDYNLQELRLYTINDDDISSRALTPGETFTVLNLEGNYDAYLATSTSLVKTNGATIIRASFTQTVPLESVMTEGVNYLVNFTNQARNTIYRKTKDGVTSEEITAGTYFVNSETEQVFFFDGEVLKEQAYPYLVLFIVNENIQLYNTDGTPRKIPYSELIDKYPGEGGVRPQFLDAALQHSVLLRGQTKKYENWPYLFRQDAAKGEWTWQKDLPFLRLQFIVTHTIYIRIVRGDGYAGADYRLEGVNPLTVPMSNLRVIRVNNAVATRNTDVEWNRLNASQKEVQDLTQWNPSFITISSAITPALPLSKICYINLAVNQSSIFIPIPATFQSGYFYCSDASTSWVNTDEAIFRSKSVSEIKSLSLASKVAVIGDETNTFEMLGVRSPGPFIYRNSNRAVQIIKKGTIFEVTDMLLQLLDTQTATVQTSDRTIYTTSTALTPQNRDLILIDGVGNINLSASPVDGFRFVLDDRKSKRLGLNRNWVIPAAGQTAGLGQGDATTNYASPLTWDADDAGSFSTYIYEAASNNWIVLLTREVVGTSITQAAQKPLIFTTNTDVVAQPYDRFYLGGTGSILLTQVVAERSFIDIDWSVGANWVMKVICPIGFTILGKFEDLDINTALTSVTHLRLALQAGNDFGISA
jgi:hypothetical protein